MFVPFDSLPPQARIWIYQSNKKFTDVDKNTISEALTAFTERWQVHGQPIETSFDIRFDQFIILAANDSTSGCSIDSSVRAVKEVGSLINVDFFDRTRVAFKLDQEKVMIIPLNKLSEAAASQNWGAETPTFNNLVETKSELQNRWIVNAGSTWLKRYLPQPIAAS